MARTYGDLCGIARALDVVGDRWSLLVVRELLLGPKRFTDVQAGLVNVSPDVLAQRLRELEQAGVVRRRMLPPPARVAVYELTERGQELEPVLLALGRWGSTAPVPSADAQMGADSLVLALKTLFDPAAAEGLAATVDLRVDDQRFRVDIADGRLHLRRGGADRPTAVVAGDARTLAAVLWQGLPLGTARRGHHLHLEGDVATVRRFVRVFPLPRPA